MNGEINVLGKYLRDVVLFSVGGEMIVLSNIWNEEGRELKDH